MTKGTIALCVLALLAFAKGTAGQGFDAYGGTLNLSCSWPNSSLSAPITSISQSGTTTTTVVLSQPLNLWVGENIFVSGTTHFNNTTAPSQLQVASITDSTHFTYTNTVSQTQTDNAGTIIAARWSFEKLDDVNGDPRWFFCTPLGNAKINMSIYGVGYGGSNINFQGRDNGSILKKKYAPATALANSYQTNWSIQQVRRLQTWGWNSLANGRPTSALPLLAVNTDTAFLTPDDTIPDQLKLPFWENILTYWPIYNANGYSDQGVKNFFHLIKQGTGFWTAWYTYDQAPDVFDSRFSSYLSSMLQNDGRWNWYKNKHNDFFMYWDGDESDNSGWAKAGTDFPTVSAGAFNMNTSLQTEHFGWAVLISSPVQTGANKSNLPVNSSSYAKNFVYANDSANHTKQELGNWLCGNGAGCSPTDLTTGVSATRSGTTVTMTVGSPNPYIPNEAVSVDNCADATFRTVAGTPVTIASVTSTTIVFTLAGVGTSTTGCRVFTGPNYGTIAALNTAWASYYDAFRSDAVTHTDTLCPGTWDGVQKSCSFTLASTPVTPMSIFVTVNGVNILGDDARGILKVNGQGTTGVGNFTDTSNILRGTITYASGVGSITFATAPANGATVQAVYFTNGWGVGHGLLDEDNSCPAKGANPCWMPADSFYTPPLNLSPTQAQLKTDLDNFLFHYAKQFYKSERTAIQAVTPGILMACNDTWGGWSSPPRAPVLQASGYYCDLAGFKELPIGPDPYGIGADTTKGNQARIDFIASNFGDKPLLNFIDDFFANPDSSLAHRPGGEYQYTTQEERGESYLNAITTSLDIANSAGTHPIVEMAWWGMYDDQIASLNFGLVDWMDNPYDGHSASPNSGTDSWGYATGCWSYPKAMNTLTMTNAAKSLSPGANTSFIASDFTSACNIVSTGCTPGAALSAFMGGQGNGLTQGEAVIINRGLGDEETLGSGGIQGGYLLGNNGSGPVSSGCTNPGPGNCVTITVANAHSTGFTVDSNYPACDGNYGTPFGNFVDSAARANNLWLNHVNRPLKTSSLRAGAP